MKKASESLALVLALSTALSTSGCATILRGTKQDVNVESESRRATVRADGAVIEPGSVELRRSESHTFTAEEPGKSPTKTKVKSRVSWGYAIVDTLFAVVLFPVGLIWPIVDLVDGAMFNLEPERVYLPPPAEPSATPPPTPAENPGSAHPY